MFPFERLSGIEKIVCLQYDDWEMGRSMEKKKRAHIVFRQLLLMSAAIFLLTSCGSAEFQQIEDTTPEYILEIKGQLPYDTTSEKVSNPCSVYQTASGKLYLLENGRLSLYEKDSSRKVFEKENVSQFIVYGNRIYYAKDTGGEKDEDDRLFYDFFYCNLKGEEDEKIASDIYSFGINEKENTLFYFGSLGGDCVKKMNLETGKTEPVLDSGVLLPLEYAEYEGDIRISFRKNKIYFADGSDSVTEFDLETAEEDYFLNEMYHTPYVEEVYIKGDWLYYTVYDKYSFAGEGNQTGVWKRNLESGEIQRVSSGSRAAYLYSVKDDVDWQNIEQRGGVYALFDRYSEKECTEQEYKKYIEKEFGISFFPDAKILEGENTHDGFLGDGETKIRIQLSEKNAEELAQKIVAGKNWESCPLKSAEEEFSPHVEVKRGYYRILNENEENDYSLNYSAVVFDLDTNQFYYYRQDT